MRMNRIIASQPNADPYRHNTALFAQKPPSPR
jgi:hypothetical protein